MVALGSAYHTHHESLTIGEEGRQPRQLDIFTMQQYSMAMSKLSTNSNFPSKDRLTVTLLCCVTFVCIETLRNNWRPALAHLSNGLRIIETLPMSTLDKLRDTHAAQDWSKSTDDQIAMDYILRLFATWEVSSALFTEDFKPVICLKLYEGRELDDTALPEFESVLHAHRHGVQYARDVFALVWQTRKHQGDEEFWSQSRPQRQHEVLMNRGSELSDLFANFMKSPRGPAPETDAYYSACLDIMHCKCTRLLCENLRLKTHQRSQSPEVLARYAELVTLCIPIHQRLVARRGQAPKMPRAFTLDIGIVPSVHFIAATCQDPIVQRSALHILRDYPQREGFWDGNSVRNLIVTADSVSSDPTHPLKAVPKSLALARGIPALYEKLEELRVSVKNDVRTP
ncbi:hypothetical protein CTRI78_v007164 [Colletotrichum trifolii]|uniref:C6 zinc finger domain protein n=1 Tax=Colletotrichum trifolii TaxID=5466 RepID=A0A4R8RA05_COLTR|nr:hypothetical protein CTRI78_v007164 [Colletotrichum trifolii]